MKIVKYWIYTAIVLGLVMVWHCIDISHIKPPAVLMGIGLIQFYILYEIMMMKDK